MSFLTWICFKLLLVAHSSLHLTDRATYWKSQPKKFCDFCKCWITDNKPSVDFHEKGKKHQENVKRKIDEVRKKSTKDAEKKEEAADDFRKMEEAALEAFKKDLAENPELAAQYNAKIKAAKEKQNKVKEEQEEEKKSEKETESTPEDAGEWLEAKSPEGYSYYWHTITQEPVWVAPEKFVSLEEQKQREEEKAKEESAKLMALDENPVEPEPVYTSASNIDTETIVGMSFGPQPQQPVKHVYGSWITTSDTVVMTKEEPAPLEPVPVDCIPLPGECEPPPDQSSDQQQKPKKDKFREKKVTSLGGAEGEPVAFKKRKIASGARNTRRRDDDD